MSINHAKPKLLFFQSRYDDSLPEFLLVHTREHVKCLSLFFDVTVIQHDRDYQQLCDEYEPDLALFESGVNLLTCEKPRITNLNANRSVPRLALLNADAWCETRSGSLSEMDRWGVEAVFSISVTAPEHMPALAGNLFVWPNFIDPEVYKDYGQAKLIPVMLAGATAAQYPWRRRVYKLVSEHYPSLSCPHRGYLSRSPAGQVLHGESYARTINASQVAPVCGTVAREVVRKHFEIPGCNTCLITERSRHLDQAGFVDMKNCVFADEHDVLDKLAYLFENPEKLRQISAAGQQLVHSRHTLNQRDQILQWLNLRKSLKPGEVILQSGPFARLTVSSTNVQRAAPSAEVTRHLQLLREGDEQLWAGQVEDAESRYSECLSYMRALPEARFKIALCKLYQGDAAEASKRIFELIQYCVAEYGAADPDPVEWAYYIVSLLCTGSLRDARSCAVEFPGLRHPHLDRVRQFVLSLSEPRTNTALADLPTGASRRSIHSLPEWTQEEWSDQLRKVLSACGQWSFAQLLHGRGPSVETRSAVAPHKNVIGPTATLRQLADHAARAAGFGLLRRELLYFKVARKLRKISTKMAPAAKIIKGFMPGWPISSGERKTLNPLISEEPQR